MKRHTQKFVNGLMTTLLICLGAASLSAQARTEENRDERKEAREEAKDAARVLNEMMKKPDDFIPRELLEKAEAIAIFPGAVKAAFIIVGRGGDGVVARRTASGWSVPVYFKMGGASFGAQIGVKKTDYIMLFMNEGSMTDLLDEKVEFGGDVSFAAGPVGRTAGAATNPTLSSGIFTYSRSEGAFIGASIKGAVISADNDVNKAVYGMTAKELLKDPTKISTAGLPEEITKFTGTLASYTGRR